MMHHKPIGDNSGFALLLTIVVISVVLAVGLSLLDITVKQISLSITSRDSELAFNGAQGAMECIQGLFRDVDIFAGAPPPGTVDCLGQSGVTLTPSADTPITDVTLYEFEVGWDNSEQNLCSQADTYIIDARSQTSDYTVPFGAAQGNAEEVCEAGNICTVVFARGFNRACADIGSLRTVQRELTISF